MKPPKTIIGGNRGKRSNGREWVISPTLEREHVIPAGAKLAFVRNDKQAADGPEYLFLVLLPDDPPQGVDEAQQRRARQHDQATQEPGYCPF